MCMAGPGGGSRGSSGSRSSSSRSSRSSFGGSSSSSRSRSGSFSSFHTDNTGRNGWGWHRSTYYNSGCCFGGLIRMLVIPFVLIMFVMSILAGVFGGGMETLFNGGRVQYNEETFHDYTNEQYRLEFADSAGFEDNLLIVFLIDEDYYDYHYIAWVGDHIATDINHMLGGNYTELGSAMSSCINDSCYKYSLDADLARVMEQLTKQIEALELESSFNCEESRQEAEVRLVNRTELPMTVETVENALREFADTTGIPTVILVENMEAVFGKTMPVEAIVSVLVLGGIVILVIVLVVKRFRKKRSNSEEFGSGTQYTDTRYRDFEDRL